jgi:leucyl aminopeptidase (aminopeptidase T)
MNQALYAHMNNKRKMKKKKCFTIELHPQAKDLNQHFSEEVVQMASNYVKVCSMSLTIREIQIKTTMKYHFAPTRMAPAKKTENDK